MSAFQQDTAHIDALIHAAVKYGARHGMSWKIPGAECVANGGAVLVRFVEPVFVSADKISVEGMPALKANFSLISCEASTVLAFSTASDVVR